MKYIHLLLALTLAFSANSQTILFDNPTCVEVNHFCTSNFEIINDNKLEPINNTYYYRIGQADYDDVYTDLLRIYVETTIDSLKVFPEFNCVDFKETTSTSQAHFDFRIGHNIGSKAPEPPIQFGNYTLAYTWGVYDNPAPYLNQVWLNYDALVWLGDPISTLMHECLHRFNIDHSDVEDAIMYFALNDQTSWHQDDLDAISHIYSELCPSVETPTNNPSPCDTIVIEDTARIDRLLIQIDELDKQNAFLRDNMDRMQEIYKDLYEGQLQYIDVYSQLFTSKYRLKRLTEPQIVDIANNLGLVASINDRKSVTCSRVWDKIK